MSVLPPFLSAVASAQEPLNTNSCAADLGGHVTAASVLEGWKCVAGAISLCQIGPQSLANTWMTPNRDVMILLLENQL